MSNPTALSCSSSILLGPMPKGTQSSFGRLCEQNGESWNISSHQPFFTGPCQPLSTIVNIVNCWPLSSVYHHHPLKLLGCFGLIRLGMSQTSFHARPDSFLITPLAALDQSFLQWDPAGLPCLQRWVTAVYTSTCHVFRANTFVFFRDVSPQENHQNQLDIWIIACFFAICPWFAPFAKSRAKGRGPQNWLQSKFTEDTS